MPFAYGGSTDETTPAATGYQAVGFAYQSAGPDGDTAGDERNIAAEAATQAGADHAEASAVPTAEQEPYVPRFEVPPELKGSLPTTERIHKARDHPLT